MDGRAHKPTSWGLAIFAAVPIILSLPLLITAKEYLFLLGMELKGQISGEHTGPWLAVLFVPPGFILVCIGYIYLTYRLIRASRVRAVVLAAGGMLVICFAAYRWLFSIFY